MSHEKDTKEIAYIATGDHPGNRVSIIEVENVSPYLSTGEGQCPFLSARVGLDNSHFSFF